MLVAAYWYNCMSSSLLGTIVPWVCAQECFRGAGIDNLVLETFVLPPAPGVIPGACVLKLTVGRAAVVLS